MTDTKEVGNITIKMHGGDISTAQFIVPTTTIIIIMIRLALLTFLLLTLGDDNGVTGISQDVTQSDKKIVCYVVASAIYRPGYGKFRMEDINPYLCTHLVYGFAKLEHNRIQVMDPYLDLQDEFGGGGGLGGYKRVTSLKRKNPNLKVMISLGRWSGALEDFSRLARDSSARREFVQSVVPFLRKYNFDGLDLLLEYPLKEAEVNDKNVFTLLVQDLRIAFNAASKFQNFLLSAVVSGGGTLYHTDKIYNPEQIFRHLDFISVQSYDYHEYSANRAFTGHNAPLYEHPLDPLPRFDVNNTVRVWLYHGIPKEKLILGIPFYGRGFRLKSSEKHGLYAQATAHIEKGPYTRQDGIWGYNEICEKFSAEMQQWKVVIDAHAKAPYAFRGKDWIGYDDVESVYYKAEYARKMELGGAMVWSLDMDDFGQRCHVEKYSLLTAVRAGIYGDKMPYIPERPVVVASDI